MRAVSTACLRATTLGVLMTTVGIAAAAVSPAVAARPTAPKQPIALAPSAITAQLADRTLRYGQEAVVSGRIAGAGAGREVVLEYRTHGGAWHAVARGLTGPDGGYRLQARLERSGAVRVLAGGALAATTGTSDRLGSRERSVRVAAIVGVRHRRLNVRQGGLTRVSGRVLPAIAGRRIVLERRGPHGRWATLARARTRSGGAYLLRHRSRSSFSAIVRVRLVGDAQLASGRRVAGRMNILRAALASWYGEGQGLACGGSLTPRMMGVAHKTLPCGTKVTIRYRGRQVRVPVVDRGPYVGGREWDLGPGVRAALRFDGVGTVYVAH